MVKGISRQVIVLQSPGDELFEQAIFILNDKAVGKGVTEEVLLRQARQAIRSTPGRRRPWLYGPVWACGGAVVTGLIWLLTVFL